MLRIKTVKPGKWRTLEWFWNATGTAFFLLPAGARIKVRYGIGWFGKDRQKATLDGREIKRLVVGRWSLVRARMQMRVEAETTVEYEVHPGNVAVRIPVELRPGPSLPQFEA